MPGVALNDVEKTALYGEIVVNSFNTNKLDHLQHELINAEAVVVKPNLMFIETKGAVLFKIWANFIDKKKNKLFWLRIFKYYLFVAIFIIAPIVVTINMVIFRPFILKNEAKNKLLFTRRITINEEY